SGQAWTGLSVMGQIAGTPAYMAPEQLVGQNATSQTDVYAFGLVLYEMVCGVLPFPAGTPAACALKRLADPPADPRRYAADLPEGWNAAFLRCLARDPVDRFPTIQGAASAFELAALCRPRFVTRTARWVALAVLAAIVIGGALTYKPVQPPGSAPVSRSSRPAVALLGFANVSGDAVAAYH